MGISSHLNLSFSSGEMRVFICFLVAVSICCAAKRPGRPNGPRPDSDAKGRQYYNYGCCSVKAVEMNDTAVEMFALMDAYPYYEMPNFCNSLCVYVKMSELKPIMDQMSNMTMNSDYDYNDYMYMSKMKDDSDMMEAMMGKEQWMMMKLRMEVQKLQKYCFKDSEDSQAMCADPNMYMDVFGMIMNGLGMGGMNGGMGSGDYGYGGMGSGDYGYGNGGMGSGDHGYTEGGMGSGDYGYTETPEPGFIIMYGFT